MATEECASTTLRGALFCSHDWDGRRVGAFGGVHCSLSNRKYGQRFRKAGQSFGCAPTPPIILLDSRAAIIFHTTLIHCTRSAGCQTDDRGQAHSSWSHVHG